MFDVNHKNRHISGWKSACVPVLFYNMGYPLFCCASFIVRCARQREMTGRS